MNAARAFWSMVVVALERHRQALPLPRFAPWHAWLDSTQSGLHYSWLLRRTNIRPCSVRLTPIFQGRSELTPPVRCCTGQGGTAGRRWWLHPAGVALVHLVAGPALAGEERHPG